MSTGSGSESQDRAHDHPRTEPHSCDSSDLIEIAPLVHTKPLYDALRARKPPFPRALGEIRPTRF